MCPPFITFSCIISLADFIIEVFFFSSLLDKELLLLEAIPHPDWWTQWFRSQSKSRHSGFFAYDFLCNRDKDLMSHEKFKSDNCTECWGRVSKGFSPHPGLNCGPLDYETSVITTTPRKLRFSLEKKLQIWAFLHFSGNWAWFRSFKNLEQKIGAIFS